jgi:hypothetical protein
MGRLSAALFLCGLGGGLPSQFVCAALDDESSELLRTAGMEQRKLCSEVKLKATEAREALRLSRSGHGVQTVRGLPVGKSRACFPQQIRSSYHHLRQRVGKPIVNLCRPWLAHAASKRHHIEVQPCKSSIQRLWIWLVGKPACAQPRPISKRIYHALYIGVREWRIMDFLPTVRWRTRGFAGELEPPRREH